MTHFGTIKRSVILLLLACCFIAAAQQSLETSATQRLTEEQLKLEGKKVQNIVFLQDDAQYNMVTKIYVLKHVIAADLQPFVSSAVKRFDPVSVVSPINDKKNKRQLLIVSTGQNMMPYVDKLVETLDRPGKKGEYDSIVYGTGIAYGVYRPQLRAAESMVDVLTVLYVVSSAKNARLILDSKTNTFYFKDSPSNVIGIKEKLSWLDQEIPQAAVSLKIYEVRDSDLKDIGIDYLAWKNGPGLNLFEAGYEALNMKVAETIIQQMTQTGADLFGNFGWGFGGIYTAPAFDFSFIRILQQNGRAIISSTAQLTLSNEPSSEFRVNFSPEYQNILKDENHRSSVAVGGDATLTAFFSNVIITGGKQGVVNFSFTLTGNNVVERNNMGTEISEKTDMASTSTLEYNRERVIASWDRISDVEQTIGIPFLCELPVLKYIFGTTTSNTETTHYYVTARAVPVNIQDRIEPGIMAEFDTLVKKQAKGSAEK